MNEQLCVVALVCSPVADAVAVRAESGEPTGEVTWTKMLGMQGADYKNVWSTQG